MTDTVTHDDVTPMFHDDTAAETTETSTDALVQQTTELSLTPTETPAEQPSTPFQELPMTDLEVTQIAEIRTKLAVHVKDFFENTNSSLRAKHTPHWRCK